MATIHLSEPKVKALTPPTDKDREYHKDSGVKGLQLCITAAGSKTYYFVRRMDGKPTRYKLGTVEELSLDQARKAAQKKAGEVADGKNPQSQRRAKIGEPTLGKLWEYWLAYATAHKKPEERGSRQAKLAATSKALGGPKALANPARRRADAARDRRQQERNLCG